MTKDNIITLVAEALNSNNTILIATLGNGGSGENQIAGESEEVVKCLKSMDFDGEVEPSDDIRESPIYESEWPTYQFSGSNGYCVQINIG